MAKKQVESFEAKIIDESIENVMHNSIMPYSEYVILDRALPRVEDGLKPVQRRILYTMLELGVTPDKQHRKSARIVGDCLGKYHPHGDTSVYDAMVRMAQNYNMRMCLVDGHGNYGSIDGDRAAAMRYTEARLTPLAMEMLRDIDKNTVKWSLNFDDTLKEPEVLPSRFPNLLVNGSSGIAVGLATNIPPHNLTECIDGAIAFIDNPKISLVNMMKIIKGPDFPTGGYIIGGEELFNAYLTGRGKIKVRAKAEIEIDTVGRQSIVITEMPYQVNKANALQKISDLREKKKDLFADIADIVDESDRNGMRAVIKLKKDAKAKKILQSLFKYSDLEVTFGINTVALAGGKPKQLGLLDLIRYYVDYQRSIIHKRTLFDLNAAKAREHILGGLIIAIKNIDAVIKTIRSSRNQTEAKQVLREKFSLSEKQAQAICDMRLGRLTQLEIDKLEQELAGVIAEIKIFEKILSSQRNELDVVKKELGEIRKAYKTERRSEFLTSQLLSVPVKDANIKEDKDGVLVLSASGDLKLVGKKSINSATISEDNCNAYEIYSKATECDNKNYVSAFTNKGNFCQIDIDTLDEKKFKSKGLPLEKICKEAEKGEFIVGLFTSSEMMDKRLLFYTKNGYVRCVSASEFTLSKSFYQAMVLKDDEVIGVEIFEEGKSLLMLTKGGMGLKADVSDVPLQGRKSIGVRGIQLNDGDEVKFAGLVDDEGEIIIVDKIGKGKRILSAEIEQSKRYRKGLKFADADEGIFFAESVKDPYYLAFVFEGSVKLVNTEDIPILARTARSKDLLKNVIGEFSEILKLTHSVKPSALFPLG